MSKFPHGREAAAGGKELEDDLEHVPLTPGQRVGHGASSVRPDGRVALANVRSMPARTRLAENKPPAPALDRLKLVGALQGLPDLSPANCRLRERVGHKRGKAEVGEVPASQRCRPGAAQRGVVGGREN